MGLEAGARMIMASGPLDTHGFEHARAFVGPGAPDSLAMVARYVLCPGGNRTESQRFHMEQADTGAPNRRHAQAAQCITNMLVARVDRQPGDRGE